ncbi:MAG: hypothetical protein KC912_02235 [Proteobacteria bacterium]|nr:hypothetical protein [Pseudomonadota bacterium]
MTRSTIVSLALALSTPSMAGDIAPPTPTALVQTWVTAFDQDEDPQADPASYGDPEHDMGFSIQRARAGVEGEVKFVRYELTLGLGAPFDRLSEEERDIGLIDAYAGFDHTAGASDIAVTFGTQRVPFSRDTLVSSTDLVFQERSVGHSWIAPNREVGGLFDWQHSSGLRARVGAFNGGGDIFGNNDNSILAAARLEFAKGNIYRSWDPSGETAFGVGLASFYAPGLTSNRFATGGDVLLRVANFNIMGEANLLSITPGNVNVIAPDVSANTSQFAWSAQLSYFIPVGEGIGGIEPAVRAASFDDAMGVSDNGDVLILHAGASWRDLAPGVDVGVGFVHREETGGRAYNNDTARLWLQVRYPVRGQKSTTTFTSAVSTDLDGAYAGSGALSGVTLNIEGDGAYFEVTESTDAHPAGTRIDATLVDRNDAEGTAQVQATMPSGNAVTFELEPQDDGSYCGWGYEDGSREEAMASEGGGSWVCWS